MNTFELERDIDFILNNAVSVKQYKEGYKMLAETAIELSIKYQALVEAMSEIASGEQIKSITLRMGELIEEHTWRNTTPEEREKLAEYGYTKPIVLMDKEESVFYFMMGRTVYLLERDNTEKAAESKKEIEEYINNGGFCGVEQFSVDMVEDFLENREEE